MSKKPAPQRTIPQILVEAFFGTGLRAAVTIGLLACIAIPQIVLGLLSQLFPFLLTLGVIIFGFKYLFKGFR